MNKTNYLFRGISFPENECVVCVAATSLENAWQEVSITHPEFWSISFIGIQ